MKLKRNVSVLFLCVALVSCKVVDTEEGKVEGTFSFTRRDEKFYAFRRIPFAEPPIGNLRFLPPTPKEPWSDVLDCTAFGPMCMQKDEFDNGLNISENCLHLNVFTKNLPSSQNQELVPVIAYIHGGGFEQGSSIEYDPLYLMERNLVVVTINYRLGAFGFMALETSEVSGNQGLKDQAMALSWIRRNIKHFGGDPDKVTLAGLSAGGYSATAHMVSPMSAGLFHNVIAMSGAIAWQKKLRTNNIETVRSLALKLNCTVSDNEKLLNCLRIKSGKEIASNMASSFFKCPVMNWIPVIEPNLGQQRFLLENPSDSYREGNFSRVKVMASVTENEFIAPVADILGDPNMTAILNKDFELVAPECFFFEETATKSSQEIGNILRKFYLPFDVIDIRSFNNLNNLFADGVIGFGIHKFVHLVSHYTDVFYYKFGYVGRFSLFNYPAGKPFGVHHADDIQYVFGVSFIGPAILLDDPENFMIERMTRIWEQFASTGDPNIGINEILNEMHWPKHESTEEYFLDIGEHCVTKNGLHLERFSIWDKLDESSSAQQIKSLTAYFCALFVLFLFT